MKALGVRREVYFTGTGVSLGTVNKPTNQPLKIRPARESQQYATTPAYHMYIRVH